MFSRLINERKFESFGLSSKREITLRNIKYSCRSFASSSSRSDTSTTSMAILSITSIMASQSCMDVMFSLARLQCSRWYQVWMSLHWFLLVKCFLKAISSVLFDTWIFWILGLCHDVSHTARTNLFEVNSMSKLAIRYHDKSVLEQHHLAVTFKILHKKEANIL